MKRVYSELWHKGFDEAFRHTTDGKESVKNIVSAFYALSKAEATHAAALQGVTSQPAYKLHPCDEGTTLNNAWDIIIAGLGSIGSQHTKIAEDLSATADGFEAWRKKEGEDRRKVNVEGTGYIREHTVFEAAVTKAKNNYIRAAKNVEAAVQKRDECIADPLKKDQVYRMSTKVQEALEIYENSRAQYIDALEYLQAAELVHRDRMIQIMANFEELERKRLLEAKNILMHMLESREKETGKIMQVIGSMKGMVSKISEVDDVHNYVVRHPVHHATVTTSFESMDTPPITMNLSYDLPSVPPAPMYPDDILVKGYVYKERPVEERKGILGLFGFGAPAALPARPKTKSPTPPPGNTHAPAPPTAPPPNKTKKAAAKAETFVVTALYDFDAMKDTDLPLRAGDVITVSSKINADWWVGTVNGLTGDFPASYVQIGEVDLHPVLEEGAAAVEATGEDEYMNAVALYDYTSEEATDLPIVEGEVLWVQSVGQTNWVRATNERGESGMVPVNYIQLT